MPEVEPRFSAADINLVIHATEKIEKVLESLEDILLVPVERFSSSNSEGHYKNEILLLKAMLSSQEAGSLATRIVSLLSANDKHALSSNLHKYADEKGNLYLRIDKQRLCQGKISLSETDAIRIKFRPVKKYKRLDNVQSYRGLLSSAG